MYAHAAEAAKIALPGESRDIWIIGWGPVQPNSTSAEVVFVLSCATNSLGAYPIFIFTPLTSTNLKPDFVRPRVLPMVRALRANVSPERVFSVFACDALTDAFAEMWIAETRVQLDKSPVYYHADLMYCDRGTLRNRELPSLPNVAITLRPAVDTDIRKVATLCHSFAETSEPFVLSLENAHREAQFLIQKQQLWVHEIQNVGKEPTIASIVAVTRVTNTVAGITKVFTDSQWRSRGCAERLMRYVCHCLLENKDAVVLYVAHNNPAAATVYKHVGFVGNSFGSNGVTDSWKELGFDRSKVELGHW